ncbi:MAG: DegT/DnrJ/EryC1/StrS aminotransferase family protein [Candidatus Riflebacteria bacterium]|nr:DegT/DnrJ/EryC1/StrS aminotransferase family protein [Candidatus Riflebacteria bacterium]
MVNSTENKFSAWPVFEDDEIESVVNVLQSGKVNYWTGDEGRNFENEFAKISNSKYAVALTNGTVALELALHSLNIGAGSEVIVTPRTFIASASCIVRCGGVPVMADIDPESQNILPSAVERAITNKTKAIIAVHLAGWPCEMDSIMDIATKHGLKVIEDCAQATGAAYKGHPVGCLGHVGAFSFCQDKIITTGGEGGMLTTNDPEIWEKAWAFKDHGKSFDAVYNRKHAQGFRWLHESFGTNWRMLEMQASIGRIALKKLSKWVEIRRNNASILTKCFKEIPALRVTVPPKEVFHSYYKYYSFLRPEYLKPGWNRDKIIELINNEGIPCFSGSCSEIYLEKAFEDAGLQPRERLPVAQTLGETSLMFLVHPTLSEENMNETVRVVKRIFAICTK